MTSLKYLPAVLVGLCLTACQQHETPKQSSLFESPYAKGTFGYDLDFLKTKDSVVVLNSKDGKGEIIISPRYQAKVFTSTADGAGGKSFGWINYKTFDQEKPDDHMNAYGGEDRLWLGPEGGKFSLFFKPRTKMEFANWHTPAAVDNEAWKLLSNTDKTATLRKSAKLLNYAGTTLTLSIDRTIAIIEPAEIKKLLNITFDDSVQSVAFRTTTVLTNNGGSTWDKQTGAPCIWNLDMFSPSSKTVTVVPYNPGPGKVATTDYFGEIPKDRIKMDNGILLFKADGKSRGKLGMEAAKAKNIAGNYDGENNVLTIILFDTDKNATYLNQEWRTDRDPFTGDAVNAYNDGPLADGSQMGPFYELESVSPAAFLKPGGTLSHHHSVFHFTGNKDELNTIAVKTLGISLHDIQDAFK
ncbi:MAG TPA: DUF6786 family protein [Mucilaginibacter sp.]|nr:DUF6786 family protein [Mucilaginibacter sp.]